MCQTSSHSWAFVLTLPFPWSTFLSDISMAWVLIFSRSYFLNKIFTYLKSQTHAHTHTPWQCLSGCLYYSFWALNTIWHTTHFTYSFLYLLAHANASSLRQALCFSCCFCFHYCSPGVYKRSLIYFILLYFFILRWLIYFCFFIIF